MQLKALTVIKHNQSSLSSKPSITGLPQSTSIMALDVTIGEKLPASEHNNQVIKTGFSSIFALRTLKNHHTSIKTRLSTPLIIRTRLICTSPTWWTLTLEKVKSCLECLMNRLDVFTQIPLLGKFLLTRLLFNAQPCLMKTILCSAFSPTNIQTSYFLRDRPHNCLLPNKDS